MKRTEEFFITGMLRTGSTLLDKLLHNHANAQCLSQPAQALFLLAKKSYLEQSGFFDGYMILSHYFLQDKYTPEDFTSFLDEFQLSAAQVEQVNEGISKLREKNPFFSKIEALRSGSDNSFIGLYRQLLAVNSSERDIMASGMKESLAEEYLPYFMKNGVKCIIILRDPRDTLASVYFGKGTDYTGTPKPVVLMTRNWRKSIAFALQYGDHENLHVLRYEDLVGDTPASMRKITDFLGLPVMSDFSGKALQSQNGEQWLGNSSYEKIEGVSNKPVGNFRKQLSPELQYYIESICFPEMKLFGYEPDLKEPDERLISAFADPFAVQKPGESISQHAAELATSANAELERLRLLKAKRTAVELQRKYFVFSKAFECLRDTQTILA